ncbi:DMT family transporter [Bacillus tianshenii]|nr:DMT family transporter [Bacillus tianshenii]
MPKINPYFALLIGVLAVSTSAIIVKLASAPAAITAAYRLLFTVILMLPVIILKYHHELSNINKKDWLYSALAGVFLSFHFILWFESLNYTSVASSVVLVTLQPIFAFAGTFLFFQERLRLSAILSGCLAIGGSILISWGDFRLSGAALFGDILALGGAVMVTAYFLIGQNIRKRLSLMTYTFLVYSFSSFTLILYSVYNGYAFFSYPLKTWSYFLLLAIVPTLLGHTLFNWTLRWLSTSVISMSILFEPVGASILAYYIFGERLVWTQWIGGFLVLLGMFLFLLFNRQPSVSSPAKRARSL